MLYNLLWYMEVEGTKLLSIPLSIKSPVIWLIYNHILGSHFYQYYFNEDNVGYSPTCHTTSL